MNIEFYRNLSSIQKFSDVAKPASYAQVPDDWWVIITDVVNSTEAIMAGRYKEVNTSGAIAIAALVNQKMHEHVPVVFGGDGITMLSPAEFVGSVKDIFFGTQAFVAKNFSLKLRIGIVSVREIRSAGFEVLAGKYSTANPFQQAIFSGSGFDYAEKLIKGNARYLLSENHEPHLTPNFTGFSCPFLDIKSNRGPVLCLIVRQGSKPESYETVVIELLELLGHEQDYYPIDWPNLTMGTRPGELSEWATVAAGKKSGFKYAFMALLFSCMTRLLGLMMGKKMASKAAATFPQYTDHRKFDGSLKMVVSCSPEHSVRLKTWLDQEENAGRILYGLHESTSSMLTCLFNGSKTSAELHLVDGADGGYALAAKSLKQKLAQAANLS